MIRRFTQRAQRAILHAQEEARELNHAAVGTEHLLLGLIREGEGVAARALLNLGADLGKIREEVAKVIGRQTGGWQEGPMRELPLTPRAKRVLNLAFEESS